MFTAPNTGNAVIDDQGQVITYPELNNISKSISFILGSRSLILCLCKNTIGSLLGYVSFINNKSVPILVNYMIDNDQLMVLINKYKPHFLFIPKEKYNDFKRYDIIYEIFDYLLLKTNIEGFISLNPDLSLLLTTSGSTGSPKFVRQSYKNIISNTSSIIKYLDLNNQERPITTLPMYYTYGLSVINSHLFCGATILLTQKTFMQKEFWDFFKETNSTSFAGVPYSYEILKRLRFFRMHLPSLVTMTQAGGKLSFQLHKEFAEYAQNTGRKFVVMYGQTEATARMSYLPSRLSLVKCGSMGIPIPGGKFELIDTQGNIITTPNTIGELIYEGDNVCMGYAESGEDLSKGDEFGGVLQTGDLAERDFDGFYYIVGRKKRFLKIFGSRVNLDETEQLIKSEYPNLDCACTGKDDNMLIYITNPNYLDTLRNYINSKTSIHPQGYVVKIIESIPKNETGKTEYSKL